jgi:outer membrane protein, heavy metal efflux system
MMKISFIILSLFTVIDINAQTSIESVLASISKNNKKLIAHDSYWKAKDLEYQTGLTLYNPKVDLDYLIGTPSNAGNQTDFAITQSFDYPTVYKNKKKLSEEQRKQSAFQLTAERQEVLLEAKLICIELIYRNKLNAELDLRKQNTQKWLSNFEKSLDKGQGNIMDVNKAKLQLIEINTAYQENLALVSQLNQKLTALNGGESIQFVATSYTSMSINNDFETIQKEIESNDPVRKLLEQQKVISQSEITLAKSLNKPKFEAGYHFQAILGQRFNGAHVGCVVPLWENRNKVETRQAELLYNTAQIDDHRNAYYYELKEKYDRMAYLKNSLDEYQKLFSSLNNVALLDKSLSLGQITTLEYFVEMTYYYEALKSYLRTEMEYFKTEAEFLKYTL